MRGKRKIFCNEVKKSEVAFRKKLRADYVRAVLCYHSCLPISYPEQIWKGVPSPIQNKFGKVFSADYTKIPNGHLAPLTMVVISNSSQGH
jgi:hypothetical protein